MELRRCLERSHDTHTLSLSNRLPMPQTWELQNTPTPSQQRCSLDKPRARSVHTELLRSLTPLSFINPLHLISLHICAHSNSFFLLYLCVYRSIHSLTPTPPFPPDCLLVFFAWVYSLVVVKESACGNLPWNQSFLSSSPASQVYSCWCFLSQISFYL